MFGLTGDALANGLPAFDVAHHDSVDIESRIAILGDLADEEWLIVSKFHLTLTIQVLILPVIF